MKKFKQSVDDEDPKVTWAIVAERVRNTLIAEYPNAPSEVITQKMYDVLRAGNQPTKDVLKKDTFVPKHIRERNTPAAKARRRQLKLYR